MEHTHEIEQMCVVAKGPKNGPAPYRKRANGHR